MAKKIGSAGRFGTRYGKTVRQKVSAVEKHQRIKHKCPHCHKFGVKRLAAGIYFCKKCDTKFTGKAYTP